MNASATAPAGATSVRVTMQLKSLNATIYVDDFLAGRLTIRVQAS
jgi:hypothetical protein